jgi:phosphoenolpyruvate carboxylase
MHEDKEMPIQVQVGLGMNPFRGREVFAFPISNLISVIKSYGQATWQDLF